MNKYYHGKGFLEQSRNLMIINKDSEVKINIKYKS